MAATLVLLLAMSTLLTSGVEMMKHDLVFLEVDSGGCIENVSKIFQDKSMIPGEVSGQVIGTSKFFAVLREQDLARMNVKDVKEVTPVTKLEDWVQNWNASWTIHRDLNETDLWLYKVSPSPKGKTLQQYDNQVRHGVRIAAPVMENFPNYILLSKGAFPPKYYIFVNKKEEFPEDFRNILNIFGGPGEVKVEPLYVRILIRWQ
uniref:Perivitellin protein n=1 Tax=Pomacea canaliculata TaxID=400727 RepID=J7I2U1_POMCA|nr:perivitellin protein [Pomacea canaliculata]